MLNNDVYIFRPSFTEHFNLIFRQRYTDGQTYRNTVQHSHTVAPFSYILQELRFEVDIPVDILIHKIKF